MTVKAEIIYNAECPVCAFEINAYRRYAAGRDLPMEFKDLNQADMAAYGLTRDQAARRLYVQHGEELLSGIPAFICLWREMPRYRWLARIIDLPVIRPIACVLYDHVTAPIIYAMHRRRMAKRG
ncbi:thiol-disulfide oxidoreductase DCC family protein [Actibacterium sp. 188UL27-1]|uniref:thiol-disulfide oxidoreductase DCC family protein n=1 Tax=Actibacterium sp. 188UL27-1 TaxID=2786961 RepID=UPI00195AA451|nr:DUF393 domain-containing protein [Actibacterium sp. 188UL27-1]MBM7068735.1 DUF393 domain-containing protein [Actibacterium sp. 188UL27-1]